MTATWEEKIAGKDCAFDRPLPDQAQFPYFVRKLAVSSLYLDRNQTYRGRCIVIYDVRHVTRIDQLSATEWTALAQDIFLAHKAVVAAFQPDHVNVESLGNVMPHLHWHIIPRYKSDPRWGEPIWLTRLADMPSTLLTAGEYAAAAAQRPANRSRRKSPIS